MVVIVDAEFEEDFQGGGEPADHREAPDFVEPKFSSCSGETEDSSEEDESDRDDPELAGRECGRGHAGGCSGREVSWRRFEGNPFVQDTGRDELSELNWGDIEFGMEEMWEGLV